MNPNNDKLTPKSILLITGFITCTLISDLFSQSVAINSTGAAPNASAVLDISSTTKGVLLPRMTSAQRTAIGNVAGMVVFDTELSDIHHNTGSAWVRALTTNNISNVAWQLTGNGGTSAGTNFLGTTDAVALIFKTNNTERMQISSSGEIGMGSNPETNTQLTINNTNNTNSSTQVVKGKKTQVSMGASARADSVIIIDTKFGHSGGTIEDFIGIKIGDVSGTNNTFRNSGTITNTYGLYLGDITHGTQTNQAYAIYNGDANALNYIAGNTGIGTSTPTEKLEVEGNVRFNGNMFFGKGLTVPFQVVAANYSLTADDYTVVTNASGVTITLPSPVTAGVGRVYVIDGLGDGTSFGDTGIDATPFNIVVNGALSVNVGGGGTFVSDGVSLWYKVTD